MSFKFKTLVLMAALASAPVFAADIGGAATTDVVAVDISTGTNATVADIAAAVEAVVDLTVVTANVALINQVGDIGNFAAIDQTNTGAGGNVATISQDSANVGNIGVITQNGSLNGAYISQR